MEITIMERKVDEAFVSIWNLQSSMDIVLKMQKMLFKKLGVGLHSKVDLQACETIHKLLMHEGLQLEIQVGLENVANEVDGVKKWGCPFVGKPNTSTQWQCRWYH